MWELKAGKEITLSCFFFNDLALCRPVNQGKTHIIKELPQRYSLNSTRNNIKILNNTFVALSHSYFPISLPLTPAMNVSMNCDANQSKSKSKIPFAVHPRQQQPRQQLIETSYEIFKMLIEFSNKKETEMKRSEWKAATESQKWLTANLIEALNLCRGKERVTRGEG